MIIAVGHTRWKMDRLRDMLAGRNYIAVYNGDDPHPDELQLRNDRHGRDVAMYVRGMHFSNDNANMFINDDVEYVSQDMLDYQLTGPIAGIGNLSSWIDYSACGPDNIDFHRSRGRDVQFLRTSCFHATADAFQRIWKKAQGSAQRFEKSTLLDGYQLLPPAWFIDGNVRFAHEGGALQRYYACL